MATRFSIFPIFFRQLNKEGKPAYSGRVFPYTIQAVFDGERLINGDSETLDTRLSPDVWEYHVGGAETVVRKTLLITLKSPLRFRVNGHYTDCFSAVDFVHCLYRRMQTLCAQYGDASDAGAYQYTDAWDITEKNLLWRDLTHYSARQNYVMKLGGVSGSFTLSGAFTGYELALLSFAELFHAGKNTSFGLGKIGMWELY
ncbi:MAG: CRISPR system precrRNA processing endoribonuclease RAMP protein Cas6 [Treponema sp.]|nr:CRISPR system precrRNA processing endoribonuclease RAMP protein Cas6 [Treponema sp.]